MQKYRRGCCAEYIAKRTRLQIFKRVLFSILLTNKEQPVKVEPARCSRRLGLCSRKLFLRNNFYRLAEIVNSIEDKDMDERLKQYCHEFLAEIERVGIEICRQWIRNNITPIKMKIGEKKSTKYDHDHLAMRSLLEEGIKRGELKRQEREKGRFFVSCNFHSSPPGLFHSLYT